MTSVERVQHYTKLDQELVVAAQTTMPEDASWPHRGEVIFRGVKARYGKNLPLVLSGVDFAIPAGSRIGVIGRTGAGKSTILQTLFRLVEIESGEIIVDGWNIAQIPKQRLREAIAIIPQDPVLYSGTLRANLDRFGDFDDHQIWGVLNQVGMTALMTERSHTLDTEVVENGQNFSLGQKQLICLARAMLQNSAVVVMDEATASVDTQTDRLIQTAVRSNFTNRTLIIIAHRLGTLKGCDFVIEMAHGKVERIIRQRPRPNPASSRCTVTAEALL